MSVGPVTSLSHAPTKGILLILVATFLFATMDTAGKYLMTKFNVPLVATIRYGLNLFILSALLAPRYGTTLLKTHRSQLVWLRGASLALATFFSGLALQRLPVGEAVSIFYLQSFGVMLIAGFFLKEKINIVGWCAAILGFLGVILIARPSGNLDALGVFFALLCSAVSVVYILLSRVLVKTESTMAMLFYVALCGTILFGVMLAFDWQSFIYSHWDYALLFYIGATSLLAHFLLTSAYRFAPASLLAPFNYCHIAFAAIAGWIVYNHVPDGLALLGMAMIAISGAAIALFAHLKKE
jgi:drug/metabolite transporter (DMT)-like permease